MLFYLGLFGDWYIILYFDLPNFLLSSCFQFLCCGKQHDSKQPGRKQCISLPVPHNSPSWNLVRAGIWMQELKQRPWRSAVYWLAPQGLSSHFSYSIQDHLPRNGNAHSELDTPTSITNHNNTPWTWLQANLSWESLFPNDCSLCQVGHTYKYTHAHAHTKSQTKLARIPNLEISE